MDAIVAEELRIEAHGGRIRADDRARGGARISFTLPAPRER